MGFGLVQVGCSWSPRRRGWLGIGCGASASDPSWDWGLGFLPNERDDATSEREMMHEGGLH